MELSKAYDPKSFEDDIYKMWMEGGYFRAEIDPKKKPFSIVIPPPNVTGKLHLGHALDNTLQDIMIRVKRMQGYCALWVPGTDHAGIATQIKVEETLRLEGKTRFDYGREKFIELVWEWKRKYGSRIIEQLKTLGSSCDWSRERFTMDEGCSRAVREAFVSLYEKGLIYKGLRIINRCPSCETALSDAEVEYVEKDSFLWHIRYPITGGGDLIVATTRPETMLGDTAVAVNPKDSRYKDLIGKTALLPLMNREIPIIADEYVDVEFGTGCVKITPCHDPNDFEMAKRHDLLQINIMDEKAFINKNGGKYEGLSREEAREAVIKDLESGGYLIKTEPHPHNAGTCHRCSTLVEPAASVQWFVAMEKLAGPAIEVVKDGRMTFVPERFSGVYLNWMENVRDWCISRQLWWGHRIPAWTCKKCEALSVSRTDLECCPECGSEDIVQDEDVLDTWFSSALWPFSVFGWPDKTPELDYFYPTSVICPAYDIIFFWVARMIFSGMEHMKAVPFETAFIHGLVRDEGGKKMSKSAGNGVDPVDIINEYGADALRLSLVTGVSAGNDMRFKRDKCESSKNFVNKLWNASRFVMMNMHSDNWSLPETLELCDRWILTKLMRVIKEVTDNIEKLELGLACSKIIDFVWDDFCDWYIELSKARLNGEDEEAHLTAEQVLSFVLCEILKLLHPFIPFVTEAIWQALPTQDGVICLETWPEVEYRLIFDEETAQMQAVMDVIRSVRSARAEMNVPPSKRATMFIISGERELFEENESYLSRLAWASSIEYGEPESGVKVLRCVTDRAVVLIPLGELVDAGAERIRLEKELKKARNEILPLEARLNNPGFLKKAPENVVSSEKEKLSALKALVLRLEESLNAL